MVGCCRGLIVKFGLRHSLGHALNPLNFMRQRWQWVLGVFLILNLTSTPHPSLAAKGPDPHPQEPRLLSVLPLAGQRGQTVVLTVRGQWLEGATAAWFEQSSLRAELLDITRSASEVALTAKPPDKMSPVPPVVTARLRLTVSAAVKPGAYPLRLVTARGVSNPLMFLITETGTVTESAQPHETVDQAQAIGLPSTIAGELSQHGQLDYYSFHGRRGQQIATEVLHSENFDPRLALYEPGGSWFDPHRPTRLLSEQEQSSDIISTAARGTYRLPHDGQYFLEVSGLFGEGCTGCAYLVKISRTGDLDYRPKPDLAHDFTERSFSRPLNPDWGETLSARDAPSGSPLPAAAASATAVAAAGGGTAPTKTEAQLRPEAPIGPATVYSFEAPADSTQPPAIQVPGLVEGVIGNPGTINGYRFIVTMGEKLAFEIGTPEQSPPVFNPRIGIIDSQGKEVFCNVHRAVSLFNANGEKHVYLKKVEPKVVYTFAHGGAYVLQVRDITSHYGGSDFRYKILVRPQVPHVGEISVAESDHTAQPGEKKHPQLDHINLTAGKLQKLDLAASYEEAFAGDLYYSMKGLPQGVELLPGAEYRDDRGPSDVDEDPGLVAPRFRNQRWFYWRRLMRFRRQCRWLPASLAGPLCAAFRVMRYW
jgi:hypothetical protein